MSSLVEELQRGALDPNTKVSDLLRMAKTIAVKLNLPELAVWVDKELSGYPDGDDLPEYRMTKGQVVGHNPYRGWRPVQFGDNQMETTFSTVRLGHKIAELEHLLYSSQKDEGHISMTLSAEAGQLLREVTGYNFDFKLRLGASDPIGVLDAVRNALLDWSLKLEQSGIKGEGMSFSNEERKKAHATPATIHIGNIGTFTGNVGSVSGNLNIEGNTINADAKGAISDLARQIREKQDTLGLSPTVKATLNSDLDGLNQELSTAKPEASKVRSFLASIQTIAEGAAKSLLTQGILFELSKIKF